jgi:hypothetical protein
VDTHHHHLILLPIIINFIITIAAIIVIITIFLLLITTNIFINITWLVGLSFAVIMACFCLTCSFFSSICQWIVVFTFASSVLITPHHHVKDNSSDNAGVVWLFLTLPTRHQSTRIDTVKNTARGIHPPVPRPSLLLDAILIQRCIYGDSPLLAGTVVGP